MASFLQLQEGHNLLLQQPLGNRLETVWHSQPADFINLQLDTGHVSVSALCKTSAFLCVDHSERDYRGGRQMTNRKETLMGNRVTFCYFEIKMFSYVPYG